jgi:hypothetical protein
MSHATLNGHSIARGSATLPTYGVWHAIVDLADIADLPAEPLGLTLAIGALELRGTLHRGGTFAGATHAWIVGGYGGWRALLRPRSYQHAAGVKASTVAGDAAREAGEVLDLAADRVLGVAYVRRAGTASRVLGDVVPGLWYLTPAGRTTTAARDGSIVASPFDVMALEPAMGHIVAATDSPADWTPGRRVEGPTLGSRTLATVRHLIEPGKLRTEAWAAQ